LIDWCAGLPDGIFSNQNYKFGKILEGLRTINVGIFCARMEYIMSNWYISWSFGNFMLIWYAFQRFGILCQKWGAAVAQW
jgi:hypothetical protein